MAPATNFSVVRVKGDILRRSSIGALFTRRSVSTRDPTGLNDAYGVDGTFAFYDNLNLNTYWAETRTAGLRGDAVSYRTQLDYTGDRYGLELERLVVGNDFNPEVGFVRRSALERSFASARFSPRPQAIAAIRKLSWGGHVGYITDRAGVLETRELQGQFGIEFESSDVFDVSYTRSYELLKQPFPITPEVTIPVGGYNFEDVPGVVRAGATPAVLGEAVGGARQLLQRGADERGLQRRPPRADVAVLGGAEPLGQPDRPAGGPLHHAVGGDADDLHRHPHDVRQRPAAIQLQQ